MIVIGVEVHKHSLTAVAVDEAGRMLDERTVTGASDGLAEWASGVSSERLSTIEDWTRCHRQTARCRMCPFVLLSLKADRTTWMEAARSVFANAGSAERPGRRDNLAASLAARDSDLMRRARTLSAIYVVGTFAMATAAMGSSSLNVELRGLGKSVGSTAACPDGQTTVPIIHSNRSALYCVTSARKLRKPGLDPWRIIETVRGTIPLSGGTLRTTESQQFTFTRAGTSNAIFHGRVIGGTGRYYGSTGTVSGGGKGRNGIAVWRLTFQLR